MERITSIYRDLFENPMGRMSRPDYWIIFFFNYAVAFVFAWFLSDVIYSLFALFIVVADIIFSIKRYHDSGRKGWWVLCPIANFVFLFYAATEDNEWGTSSI